MGTITQAIANNLTTGLGGAGGVNFRNIIINGDMSIDQRNSGSSVTVGTVNPLYTLDRMPVQSSQSSKFSIQQNAGSVTPPEYFKNYIGATSLSAYTVTSGDYFSIRQGIEGSNIINLAWGTSDAKTVTLSFWVRSSLTGTFGGSFTNDGFNRSYPFSYTISSANTWEKKSITVAGDTSGTWLTTNGVGIYVTFGLGVGSTYSGTAGAWSASGLLSATSATSVVGTNTATFYMTGVQLEAGTTASDFEFLPVDVNLQRCQRYYQIIADRTSTGERMAITCGAAVDTGTGVGVVYAAIQFPTPMRASATMLSATVTNGYRLLGDTQPTFNVMSASPITNRGARITNGGTVSSTVTSGKAYLLECELNGSNLMFSSEL